MARFTVTYRLRATSRDEAMARLVSHVPVLAGGH